MASPQTSIRLPKPVKEKLAYLATVFHMTKTQILIIAIERLTEEELKKYER